MRNNNTNWIITILILFFFTPSNATISTWNIGQIGGSGPEYIIIHDNSNFYDWQEAEDYAINVYGAHLAGITSQTIHDGISVGLDNAGVPQVAGVWIGGFENPSNSEIFYWVGNEPWSFDLWEAAEPNMGEDCVELKYSIPDGDYRWYDNNCSAINSWFIIADYSALPVELISFEVFATELETAQLFWQTASETNNKGFSIERSLDGRYWKEIDFVPGAGNTTEPQKYNYLDQNPSDGENYYRLKQEDFDGLFEYSKITNVTIQRDIAVSVYPNPNNGKIEFSINPREQIWIQIINCDGIIVMEQFLEDQSMNISDLPSGIYFLILYYDKQLIHKKIIKK